MDLYALVGQQLADPAPWSDLHLHVDRAGLDSLKGYGRNPLNHARPS